jgi:hypothetical protein
MSTRFLPVREAELVRWLANFSAPISASPATYNLSAGDAAQIAAAVGDFQTAFLIADAPATRTRTAVLEKNTQKKNVTAIVRRFAGIIRADVTIASADKLALGLVLRDTRPARVNPPETAPVLGVSRISTGMHALHAADENVSGRGKPLRAAGVLVYRTVGDGSARYPEQATYLGMFTRTRFESPFTAADRGKFATYFARWVNAKGEPGPWSNALSVAIAA